MTRSAFVAILAALFCTPALPAEEKKKESKEIKPILVMKGRKSKVEEKSCMRIDNAPDWEKLWATHLTGSPEREEGWSDREEATFDFNQVMIIATFNGVTNGDPGYVGLFLASVRDEGEQIRVRLKWGAVQTAGVPIPDSEESLEQKQARQKSDWLFVVLARSTKKVVVEIDHTRREPKNHEWKELKRFAAISK